MEVAEQLCTSYDERREAQHAFTSGMAVLCRTILESNGIEVAALEFRTKTSESFRDKINRPEKAGKYSKLDDITDLSGVRLILFLKDDCDKAVSILSQTFSVDEKNSSNKADLIDPDRFGYLSSHLIVSYGEDRENLIEFSPYKGFKAEIQVRTVLQHAWSAIDWRLRYKSKVEVPKLIRRRLYRISALLETADDEFAALDSNASVIRSEYSDKMKKGNRDIALDGDSIKSFLTEDSYWNKLVPSLTEELAELRFLEPGKSTRRTGQLLQLLEALNIKDIGQIRDTLKKKESKTIPALAVFAKSYKAGGNAAISQEAVLRVLLLLSLSPDSKSEIERLDHPALKASVLDALNSMNSASRRAS